MRLRVLSERAVREAKRALGGGEVARLSEQVAEPYRSLAATPLPAGRLASASGFCRQISAGASLAVK